MKEVMDFLTVSAVVAASIFFALLIEPLLLEAVLLIVDKGLRRAVSTGEYQGHLVQLQLNAVPSRSSGSEDRHLVKL